LFIFIRRLLKVLISHVEAISVKLMVAEMTRDKLGTNGNFSAVVTAVWRPPDGAVLHGPAAATEKLGTPAWIARTQPEGIQRGTAIAREFNSLAANMVLLYNQLQFIKMFSRHNCFILFWVSQNPQYP
jgi:hypothetical protein